MLPKAPSAQELRVPGVVFSLSYPQFAPCTTGHCPVSSRFPLMCSCCLQALKGVLFSRVGFRGHLHPVTNLQTACPVLQVQYRASHVLIDARIISRLFLSSILALPPAHEKLCRALDFICLSVHRWRSALCPHSCSRQSSEVRACFLSFLVLFLSPCILSACHNICAITHSQ